MVFLIEGVAGVGLALLLGVALAEWGKFRNKAEKGFNWIALGGVWTLFAGATAAAVQLKVLDIASGLSSAIAPVGNVFGIVGWIFALIGTLFAAYEVLVEK